VPIITCPHCDDRVEIEDDWYGRRIACPSCDKTFTPERPGGSRPQRAADGEDDDRPRGRSRYARDDDDDDRPKRRKRSRYDDDPPKKGNGVLIVVLVLVGVFVVLPCLGCVGYLTWWGTAKQSFDAPWADASVGVNGEVTASFPKPPTPKFMSVSGSNSGEMSGFDNTLDADNPLESAFAIGYYDFPPGGGDPLTTHFEAIRRAVVDTFETAPFGGADLASDVRTTHNGLPAREAVFSEDVGGQTLRVIHINNRPPGQGVRLVVVFVGGQSMKPEDKTKFLNSVRVGKK
jgi:hypothetical protein